MAEAEISFSRGKFQEIKKRRNYYYYHGVEWNNSRDSREKRYSLRITLTSNFIIYNLGLITCYVEGCKK